MDTLYNKFYAFYGSNIIVLFALSILAVGIAFWLIKKYINVTRKDRIAQEWAPAELHLNVPKANTPPRQFSWQPKQGNPTMPQAPWIKPGNASTKSTQDADGEFYDLFSTGSQKQQNQPKVEPKIETQVYEFVVKINEEIQKQADQQEEIQQSEPKEEILFPEPTMPKSTKALLFDYGFMAITAIITLLTTISSFIWGILR